MNTTINSFTGEYRFLSNFWMVSIPFEGLVYPSVEHAYVAAKTADIEVRCKIQKLSTPGEAKRFGRSVALRPDWEELRLPIMRSLVKTKFLHVDLAEKLVLTYPSVLIEGNTWGDQFWGVCRGVGQNHLGRILMSVRDDLIFGESDVC